MQILGHSKGLSVDRPIYQHARARAYMPAVLRVLYNHIKLHNRQENISCYSVFNEVRAPAQDPEKEPSLRAFLGLA